MRPAEILRQVEHRPWPLPLGPWVMTQRWSELLFAHWPVTVAAVRPLVPAGLAIETYDGSAWLGVVPFRMSNVRLRATPALPGVGAFPELNVRTYVRVGEKPGVYFFSLDAGSPLAVAMARRWFYLRYYTARFSLTQDGETVAYDATRTHRGAPPATLRAVYRPVGPAAPPQPGTLADFLTTRYCLYSARRDKALFRGEIHHAPWPLQPAEATFHTNTIAEAAGVALPDIPPILHYASRLDVLIWPLRKAGG